MEDSSSTNKHEELIKQATSIRDEIKKLQNEIEDHTVFVGQTNAFSSALRAIGHLDDCIFWLEGATMEIVGEKEDE